MKLYEGLLNFKVSPEFAIDLWGHYASNHAGICISYNSAIGVFKHPEKVDYYKTIHTIIVHSKSKLTEKFFMRATSKCMYKKLLRYANNR